MGKKLITVKVDEEFRRKLNDKAKQELRDLSAVTRRLWQKWLKGEIKLT